jgi:hypothetical protein
MDGVMDEFDLIPNPSLIPSPGSEQVLNVDIDVSGTE